MTKYIVQLQLDL